MPLAEIWARYVRGTPLFALALTDQQRAEVRADLQGRVKRTGIAALHASGEETRNFVLFASQFLARSATRLEWAPVLARSRRPRAREGTLPRALRRVVEDP